MTLTADKTTGPAELSSFVDELSVRRGVRVGGHMRRATGGAEFAVTDPSTGDRIALVPDGATEDAVDAVASAGDALPDWGGRSPRERSEVLRKAYELLVADGERLAGLISWENGKSLSDARAEVAYAAEFFRWFAEESVRVFGTYVESPSGATRTIVSHRPVGVAALVTPWNFPAAMATRKIAPALAAGCTVVLKPAAETPLTAIAIASILDRAGVPAGAVNVVPSTRAADLVDAWLKHPQVRKISFTGSTGIGRLLLAQAAQRVVNTSMELGGNAPFIVGPDADIKSAVAGAMVAKFRNGGQACTAANRFYVHSTVAEEFNARFGAAIESLTVGNPFRPGTTIGPMISKKAVDGLERLVAEAVQSGARISHRALVPPSNGSFYPPSLLTDVPADAPILTEELFGPVAPVVTWRDDAALLRLVNASEYGLAAYVYSKDLQWALQISERLEVGMVGVNRGVVSDPAAPFGGFKQSGLGREGASEGLRDYLETQYFSVDWPAQ